MKIQYLFYITLLVASGFMASCERNDDEPLLPPTRISRLYVSFSDIQTNELEEPYKNIAIFDPVNGPEIAEPEWFNSGVIGGAGIYFHPMIGKIIQGSTDDNTIKTFTVSNVGVLGSSTSYNDATLRSQPDLVYDPVSTNLYVSNDLDARIAVYAKGAVRNGAATAEKHLLLEGKPWGLARSEDSLFVALAGDAHRVLFIDQVSERDSAVLTDFKELEITGASDLRGIAFSKELDLMVLTDIGTSSIYIVDNIMEAFNAGTAIRPSRVITGALTTLHEPISVAIDPREGEQSIYVADRAAKKILRFKIADTGNIAPQSEYTFPEMTPVSIYLDAR